MHILFSITLFTAFTASVLLVLLFGVSAYGDITEEGQDGYAGRLCLSYIATKVRHYDQNGCVRVDTFEGLPALFLEEELDGIRYQTILYCHDGQVKELFCEKDLGLLPGDGTALLPAAALNFAVSPEGLLHISYAEPEGEAMELYLSLRAKGEEKG